MKLSKYTQFFGILNNIFKSQLGTENSILRIQNTLVVAASLYGSEIWTLKAQDKDVTISRNYFFDKQQVTLSYVVR